MARTFMLSHGPVRSAHDEAWGACVTTSWGSCAARSRELGEPLGGTAVVATGWVCVEHPGPWSPQAPSVAELGDAATALATPDVRVQLIRRPRRAHDPDEPEVAPPEGPLTVLLAHGAVQPSDRWMRRLVVEDVADLVTTIHPGATTSPTPPAIGEPVEHDVWLVCAHGRRDACCALHGRPVADALRRAGEVVWETTHTGGHRFAATALLLPEGLSLGRLENAPAAELVAAVAAGRVDPGLLRGRCAVPHAVQAAEAFARTELGIDGRDDLLPTSWATDGDDTTVSLAGPDGCWTATVSARDATPPRPVSDAAEPTMPVEHELLDLTAD